MTPKRVLAQQPLASGSFVVPQVLVGRSAETKQGTIMCIQKQINGKEGSANSAQSTAPTLKHQVHSLEIQDQSDCVVKE